MSDKRKRKENFITALLIAGMCIVIGGTIIFVVKYTGSGSDSLQLSAGVTEITAVSVESTADPLITATVPTTETSLVPTVTNTPAPTMTPTPTEEPTPTPSPVPEKLKSIKGYSAGTVIDSDKIDTDNLSQYFTSETIEEGDSVYDRIYGQSYVDNDNIDLDELRYLKMLHVNFDGDYQVGEMIVNEDVASDVLEIFEILCDEGYEIYSMYLIDDFWAGDPDDSDWYSIDANNTSAFCYRTAMGSGNLSKHALGRAIDINPQQNPYVTYDSDGDAHYSHDNASDYVYDRYTGDHMITIYDRAYELFTDYGWTWGENWSSPKDYQHFQLS
ncbi:MAG: M15 family metallopeptidase [Clostridiales bacterium]|nr:M15 family metallopeptidase [Clostridiales bacterium]